MHQDVAEAPTLSGDQAAVSLKPGESVNLSEGLVAADEDAGSTPTISARLVGGEPLPAGLTLSGRSLTAASDLAPGAYVVELFASD